MAQRLERDNPSGKTEIATELFRELASVGSNIQNEIDLVKGEQKFATSQWMIVMIEPHGIEASPSQEPS